MNLTRKESIDELIKRVKEGHFLLKWESYSVRTELVGKL